MYYLFRYLLRIFYLLDLENLLFVIIGLRLGIDMIMVMIRVNVLIFMMILIGRYLNNEMIILLIFVRFDLKID